MSIPFVGEKSINWNRVQTLLEQSKTANHWTNYGPCSLSLEKTIQNILQLPKDLVVVMCANGTSALFALIQMQNYLANKNLRWAVPSFAFSCCVEGPLAEAVISPVKTNGMLDLSKLPDCDAIVVLNLFGQHHHLDDYREFCANTNKILVVDSAMGFDNIIHKENEMISFHHTKTWGFGEGGCAIIKRENEPLFRSLCNFGKTPQYEVQHWATNAKMSDISASYIQQWLENWKEISKDYQCQYNRIVNLGRCAGFLPLGKSISTPCNVPLLAPHHVKKTDHIFATHKYYKPLDESYEANNLYQHIINLPCHPKMNNLSDQFIIKHLESILWKYSTHTYPNGVKD